MAEAEKKAKVKQDKQPTPSQKLRQKIWNVWSLWHNTKPDSPYFGNFDLFYAHVMSGLADNVEKFADYLGFKNINS